MVTVPRPPRHRPATHRQILGRHHRHLHPLHRRHHLVALPQTRGHLRPRCRRPHLRHRGHPRHRRCTRPRHLWCRLAHLRRHCKRAHLKTRPPRPRHRQPASRATTGPRGQPPMGPPRLHRHHRPPPSPADPSRSEPREHTRPFRHRRHRPHHRPRRRRRGRQRSRLGAPRVCRRPRTGGTYTRPRR